MVWSRNLNLECRNWRCAYFNRMCRMCFLWHKLWNLFSRIALLVFCHYDPRPFYDIRVWFDGRNLQVYGPAHSRPPNFRFHYGNRYQDLHLIGLLFFYYESDIKVLSLELEQWRCSGMDYDSDAKVMGSNRTPVMTHGIFHLNWCAD